MTLVSIIENHDSGWKTRLESRFSPWIGELQLPENATPVVILKSRDNATRRKNGEFHLSASTIYMIRFMEEPQRTTSALHILLINFEVCNIGVTVSDEGSVKCVDPGACSSKWTCMWVGEGGRRHWGLPPRRHHRGVRRLHILAALLQGLANYRVSMKCFSVYSTYYNLFTYFRKINHLRCFTEWIDPLSTQYCKRSDPRLEKVIFSFFFLSSGRPDEKKGDKQDCYELGAQAPQKTKNLNILTELRCQTSLATSWEVGHPNKCRIAAVCVTDVAYTTGLKTNRRR